MSVVDRGLLFGHQHSKLLMKTFRSASFLALGLGSLLTLTSCSHFGGGAQPDRYSAVADALAAQKGVNSMPLMPPREDVRVGDVFIVDGKGGKIQFLNSAAWASLPLFGTVKEHYAERPLYHKTDPELFMDDYEGDDLPESTVSNIELRPMLIGPLANVQGRNGFWKLVPPEVLALTLPPQRRPNVEVSVRASAAQAYSLPKSVVLDSALEEGNLSPLIADNLNLVSTTATVRLYLVSEVIYARVISMGIRPLAAKDQRNYWDFHDLASGPTKGLDRAANLNRQLREENLDDLPGGEVRFVSVTDDLVLFRTTMEEPIAIGVRGVVLDVDPETGEVLQVSLTHSAPLPLIEEELDEDAEPVVPVRGRTNVQGR